MQASHKLDFSNFVMQYNTAAW